MSARESSDYSGWSELKVKFYFLFTFLLIKYQLRTLVAGGYRCATSSVGSDHVVSNSM